MSDPLTHVPHCQQHFPVRQAAEHELSRRGFAKALAVFSLSAVGGSAVGVQSFLTGPTTKGGPAISVASADKLEIGGYKLFRYPSSDDPCILIRLTAGRYVAFDQRCTHLQCPVHFRAATHELVCPCHNGYFSAEDGRVLAGPPRRPLQGFPVEVRQNYVWVGGEGAENSA